MNPLIRYCGTDLLKQQFSYSALMPVALANLTWDFKIKLNNLSQYINENSRYIKMISGALPFFLSVGCHDAPMLKTTLSCV